MLLILLCVIFIGLILVLFELLFHCSKVCSSISKSQSRHVNKNQFCQGTNQKNEPCNNYKMKGENYCYVHGKYKYKNQICDINNFQKHTCNICFENKRKSVFTKLKCQHTICKTCLSKWKQRSSTCPFCRSSL